MCAYIYVCIYLQLPQTILYLKFNSYMFVFLNFLLLGGGRLHSRICCMTRPVEIREQFGRVSSLTTCILGLMQGLRLGHGYLYLLSHLSVSVYCKFGIDSSSSIFSLSLSLSQAWLPNSIHASRKSLWGSTQPACALSVQGSTAGQPTAGRRQ